MKKTYIKPATETTDYCCGLLLQTISVGAKAASSTSWETGAKARDDAEGYANEQTGANSTDGWSDGLW